MSELHLLCELNACSACGHDTRQIVDSMRVNEPNCSYWVELLRCERCGHAEEARAWEGKIGRAEWSLDEVLGKAAPARVEEK